MEMRRKTKLDPKTVAARLGVYAAALGGSAALAPDAHASIVTFNTVIPVPQTFYGVYLDFKNGATSTTGNFAGFDFNPYGTTNIGFFWGTGGSGVAATPTTLYQDLPPGTVIGPGSTFSNIISATAGSAYQTTGTHTLGFQFLNEDSGLTDFGYLTMSNNGPSGFAATILGWSFDDTGAPITVVGVPEPSSLLLTSAALAFGARGMRKWRRKTAV